jgi:integrase/recombinase XerD
MKKSPVKSDNFKYIEESFGEWLQVNGYADFTVYSMPLQLREFFNWLEKRNIIQIKDVVPEHIKKYYKQLKQRANTKRGGALGASYINKHRQTLTTFLNYLRQSGRLIIPHVKLEGLPVAKEHSKVLTVDEIKQLYEATYVGDGSHHDPETSVRDRAMLSIVYGCGLRRREATLLNVDDINLDTNSLHVKHGKNNKERIVPISKKSKKDIEDYLYNIRPILLSGKGRTVWTFAEKKHIPAFFVSMRGQRMCAGNMNERLKLLIYKTNNAELIEKEASLHTLRHSIATHLLANGMKIEKIAKLLGHSSLESTQIYTHLLEIEQQYSTSKNTEPITYNS